jgi:hypothetical protein
MRQYKQYATVTGIIATIHVLLLYGFYRIDLLKYAARGDGAGYMQMAQALTHGQLIGVHFPLYPIMILAANLVMPLTVAALVVPAVFSVLFVLVIYQILVTLKVANPVLFSLLISCFPPSMLIYSSSALSDSITLFFAALTFYYALTSRRSLMLLSSLLASASHYMGILFTVPLLYWLWKHDRKKTPLGLLPLTPIIILSLFQFIKTGNILYYVTVHLDFATRNWGTPLFSYPFASLMSISSNRIGINMIYWLGYVGLVFVVYGLGVIASIKAKRMLPAIFSIPLYTFTVFFSGYYFIPRYMLYAFPSLTEYAQIKHGSKLLMILAACIIIVSVAYSTWFMLIHVPATNFTS